MKIVRVQENGTKTLELALAGLKNKVGKVGWFKESRYPDPPNTQVAQVAVTQEYGYSPGNIPPRPFMRPTIVAKQQEWRDVALRGAKAVFAGKQTVENVLEAIGLKAAGDIRKAISNVYSPPLSPLTIAARLRRRANKRVTGKLTKPLIDTGLMFATLTNSVEDE